MFKCDLCIKTFSCGGNLRRHQGVKHGCNAFPCEQCGRVFTRRDTLQRHMKSIHTTPALCKTCGGQFNAVCRYHSHSMQAIPTTKKYVNVEKQNVTQGCTSTKELNKHVNAEKCVETDSIHKENVHSEPCNNNVLSSKFQHLQHVNVNEQNVSQTNTSYKKLEKHLNVEKCGETNSIHNKNVHCKPCNINVLSSKFQGHLKSYAHKTKVCSSTERKNVELIQSAFKSRLLTYKVQGNVNIPCIKTFVELIKPDVLYLLENALALHGSIKANVELFALYVMPKDVGEITEMKSFNTQNVIVYATSDLSDIFNVFLQTITVKSEEFQERGSGWTLAKILHLEVNINHYNPWYEGDCF